MTLTSCVDHLGGIAQASCTFQRYGESSTFHMGKLTAPGSIYGVIYLIEQ